MQWHRNIIVWSAKQTQCTLYNSTPLFFIFGMQQLSFTTVQWRRISFIISDIMAIIENILAIKHENQLEHDLPMVTTSRMQFQSRMRLKLHYKCIEIRGAIDVIIIILCLSLRMFSNSRSPNGLSETCSSWRRRIPPNPLTQVDTNHRVSDFDVVPNVMKRAFHLSFYWGRPYKQYSAKVPSNWGENSTKTPFSFIRIRFRIHLRIVSARS